MRTLESLNEREIRDLAKKLSDRISERFPTRGLAGTAHNFAANANRFVTEARNLKGHHAFLQATLAALFVAGAAGVLYLLRFLNSEYLKIHLKTGADEGSIFEVFTILQGVDAGIHILALTALAMVFVARASSRKKRRAALDRLHELRSYAHVVDIRQLDKDPVAIISGLPRTKYSPERDLNAPQLLHYLAYCSEMLSLISKFAALYAQYSKDPVVIAAVNEIELLTSSLSTKIWQKLIILNDTVTRKGGAAGMNLEKSAQTS